MKKLFATVLALVMMLSVMSVTAFAAPAAKPADLTGHTYKAFQIFSGTQSEDSGATLTNIEWGTGVNGTALLEALKDDAALKETFKDCTTAADVAKAMEDWDDSSDNAKAFAKLAYANKTGDGTACVNGETSLDAGYYLVVDVTENTDNKDNFVNNLALLQLTNKGTFEIQNKVDIPEVEKKIVEGETKVDVNSASVGEVINYEITGTMPTDIADYNTYKYVFHDTMSKGLTYNRDMKVYVNGADKTDLFTVEASEYSKTDGTTITVSIADLFAAGTIKADSKVVLKYSATLNENAVIAGAGNPNDVTLEYSNNPNESGKPGNPDSDSPTGVTPKDEVKTYTTELTVLKTDENGDKLTGAAFELAGDKVVKTKVSGSKFEKAPYTAAAGETVQEGTYYLLKDGTYTKTAPTATTNDKYASATDTYVAVNFAKWVEKTEDVKVEAYVNADGKVTFTGLGAGTYTLTETVAPAGYNKLAESIEFTVGFTADEEAGTVTFTSNNELVKVQADNTLFAKIVNQSGSTLPETGGIGTTIFYAVGGILLVGAAVMLVAKKRMDAED